MLYYFDTSIWLDLFEDRDEPNLPKSRYARELITKIINNNEEVIISNVVIYELNNTGYSIFEIKELLREYKTILIQVYAAENQLGKAKDLSYKRSVPKKDALHAILARDNNATLVSRDHHFKKLLDITKFKKPEELF